MKKTIKDIDLKDKKIICRCDFNVPMKEGNISDDFRIVSALPTLKYLLDNGAAVILCSHMGKPKGYPKAELSLAPVTKRISELIKKPVNFVSSDRVVDDKVKAATSLYLLPTCIISSCCFCDFLSDCLVYYLNLRKLYCKF